MVSVRKGHTKFTGPKESKYRSSGCGEGDAKEKMAGPRPAPLQKLEAACKWTKTRRWVYG